MSARKLITASVSNIKIADRERFYKDAEKYWETIPATVDGMLGGLEVLSNADCEYSIKIIEKYQKSAKTALDVGAGIGRVTKNVLLTKYNQTDMLEVDQKFLDEAPVYLGDQLKSRVPKMYCCGMQDFKFEKQYDCIWIQWCIGHLTDADAIEFLLACKNNLSKDGFIVIKDNLTSIEESVLDEEDSSVTRATQDLLNLVEVSGLKVIEKSFQSNWPVQGLYPVICLVLN